MQFDDVFNTSSLSEHQHGTNSNVSTPVGIMPINNLNHEDDGLQGYNEIDNEHTSTINEDSHADPLGGCSTNATTTNLTGENECENVVTHSNNVGDKYSDLSLIHI